MTHQNVTPLRETFDKTEDGTAIRFATTHKDLRWCDIWGRWMIWSGQVWQRDETVHVYDMVRRFTREASEFYAQSDGEQRRMCSAAFIAAVERLCRSDRRYAATPDLFDSDDWLLNTAGGLVDLKTGQTLPHNSGKYCTKITPVPAEGKCPRWQTFLADVTASDDELIDYLHRVVGYCLTGSTREHALFFLYGTGGNGKSVFIETLRGILGQYARTAPMEAFTESHGDRHPTELAMLQGARLVVANETESGKRWNESRIKALTGGDTITARFMRADFFEFQPKFKLVIAGNNKPTLTTVDEAMRRRFHVVPFTVQIPVAERDPDLAQTLREEWPGILAWAVRGCLEYLAEGLAPPLAVLNATSAYLEGQDVFAEWLETACDIGLEQWETPSLLFNSWKDFAEGARERIGRRSEFKERMEAAGYTQHRDNARGRHWQGIRVKPTEDSTWRP